MGKKGNLMKNMLYELDESPLEYKKLLTFPEASEVYSIPLNSLYKLSSQGKIPKVKIGRKVLIDPDSFEEWLFSHRIDGEWGKF